MPQPLLYNHIVLADVAGIARSSHHSFYLLLYRELRGRAAAEIAAHKGRGESQREGAMIHVLVRIQYHRRRDRRTLQIV